MLSCKAKYQRQYPPCIGTLLPSESSTLTGGFGEECLDFNIAEPMSHIPSSLEAQKAQGTRAKEKNFGTGLQIGHNSDYWEVRPYFLTNRLIDQLRPISLILSVWSKNTTYWIHKCNFDLVGHGMPPQYKPLYIDIKLRGRRLWSRCFVWLVRFVGILNNSPRQALCQKLGGSSLAAVLAS